MSLERYIKENGGLTRDDLLFLASVGLRYLTCETAEGMDAKAVTQESGDIDDASDAQAEAPPQVPRHGVTPLQRQFVANLVSNYASQRSEIAVVAIGCEPEEGYFLFAEALPDSVHLDVFLVDADYALEDRYLATQASVKLIDEPASDAADRAADRSIDFIVVGNQAEITLDDLNRWIPKAKHPGIVFGSQSSRAIALEIAGDLAKEYADNGAWLLSVSHLRDMQRLQEADDA